MSFGELYIRSDSGDWESGGLIQGGPPGPEGPEGPSPSVIAAQIRPDPGSVLTASPKTGDEIYFATAADVSGVILAQPMWHLRYDGSGWQYLGGAPYTIGWGGSMGVPTSWTQLGPSVRLPPGSYLATVSAIGTLGTPTTIVRLSATTAVDGAWGTTAPWFALDQATSVFGLEISDLPLTLADGESPTIGALLFANAADAIVTAVKLSVRPVKLAPSA